ncbi:cysteine-rich protein 3 isoform X3 [Nannospalax galili]|uniref:cysteine-rich protein 3 isoform X3 n=1 Tax=Nannospalax galili TaxID=1026970 RepID=UPI00111C5679|nr:cysteine-rich protein 3 isoform X3 [Nannospalax galili]
MNARNPKGSKLSGGRSLRGAGQTSRGAYSCGLGWAVPRGAMSWICPQCQQPVYFAEKVSSLGKNWHRFCLKCERCHSILSPGGHAEATEVQRGKVIGHEAADKRQDWPGTHSSSPGQCHGRKGPSYTKTFTGETSLCPGCGDPVYFAEKVMSLGRNWHRPCLRCQRCRKTLTAGSHAEHDGVPYCHIPCYGYLFGPKGGQPHPSPTLWECVDNFLCGQTYPRPLPTPFTLNPTTFPPKPLVIGLSPSGVNIGNVGCYIYDPVEIKSK